PGEPYQLGRVYVRGHSVLTYEQVENLLRGEFGYFSHYTNEQLVAGVDAVLAQYRRLGYIQARINRQVHKDPERLVFDVFLDVEESKHWDIQFEGNEELSTAELLETLTFFDVGFIDDAEIKASVDELEARYETAGHYWATVTYAATPVGDDGYTLLFQIDEGPRSEIEAIEFDGVTAFDEAELLDVIQTQA